MKNLTKTLKMISYIFLCLTAIMLFKNDIPIDSLIKENIKQLEVFPYLIIFLFIFLINAISLFFIYKQKDNILRKISTPLTMVMIFLVIFQVLK